MNSLRDMHDAGMTLAQAGSALGISAEAVRARARREGIRWVTYAAESQWEKMSDLQRLEQLLEGERRLLRALACAIARGEHLPQAMKAAA